jgi:DNA gyrase subunit B
VGNTYTDAEIQVLTGLEFVRRRPAMYVGNTSNGEGLHNLVWTVVRCVLDEHAARVATELHVDVDADGWISVADDGPGISVAPDPHNGTTVLEELFTQLYAGGGLAVHSYYFVAVVSALSARLEVETTRDGMRWRLEIARGIATSNARCLGPSTLEGTYVRFRPDPEIFGEIALDRARVEARLQALAWLNPLLRVHYHGKRLHALGGPRGWVEQIVSSEGRLVASGSTLTVSPQIVVDVAVAWRDAPSAPHVRSFVNCDQTTGGSHVDGLWRGFGAYAERVGATIVGLEAVREALGSGLVAIVHVRLAHPELDRSREQLSSAAAGDAVVSALLESLPNMLSQDMTLRALFEQRLQFTWTYPEHGFDR